MKIKYATLIVTLLISTNANAADIAGSDEYAEIALLDATSPSSGKVIPADLDSLYRIAISNNESIKLGGTVNFEPSPDVTQQPEATLHVKYSMNF